jgi:hypothetical protein
MTHLVLNQTQAIFLNIPKFNLLLRNKGFEVVYQTINGHISVELTINTLNCSDSDTVAHLASAFFGRELITEFID